MQAPKSGAESTVRRPRHRRSAHAGVATFASVSSQRPSPRSDSTSPGIEPPVTTQPPLSTLSVGYTNVVDGYPSATPARQRRRNGNHFRFAARNARQCGSRSGLDRDVAAAESIPADPTKQEARVPSERRACRYRSHVKCSALRAMHLEDPEGSRRRPQPGRARDRWKRPTPLWTPGALGVLPRPRRTSMRAAERRRPGGARSRFLRAEARSRRSLAPPGGLDVNADAIPALCSCRLDTTVRPHGIGLGDVATTVPAETTRKALGVR